MSDKPVRKDFTGEELADGILAASADTIAAALRALPRIVEADGSKWVNAEIIDAMASRLELLSIAAPL